MEGKTCLIYCYCGAQIISKEKQDALSVAFRNIQMDVFELHDFCAISLNEKEVFDSIEVNYDKKYIVACYPRAIEHMLVQNKVALSNYEVLNFRELSKEEIVEKLTQDNPNPEANPKHEVIKTSLKVPAWYPVIDTSRCTLCGKCANFCVFGTYKYTKTSLEVVNPLACKNNCPACGRTCPESAIIFPRLPENSVLSGAIPNGNAMAGRPNQKDSLLVMINQRNNNRQNIFKQGVIQLANEEKQKAIDELKKGKNE
jgi:NAD-dependent dihydropyrimidine dehydrogenase PreA subunit